MSLEVRLVNNITKEYDDMFKIVVNKEPQPYFRTDFTGVGKKKPRQDYVPSISSIRRTKTTVQDIVLCNDFELFCTFTFNKNKIDRYSFPSCSSCMRRWLQHQRELSLARGKRFKYLIIPEQHKDGAWHFHALISGYCSTLKDSGIVSKSGRSIYNITSFRSGFTTAVKVDSRAGVSSYITKYISKSFVKTFNGKRFFCSAGLKRPSRQLNSLLLSKLHNVAPLLAQPVAETKNQFFYVIDKKDLFDLIDLDDL